MSHTEFSRTSRQTWEGPPSAQGVGRILVRGVLWRLLLIELVLLVWSVGYQALWVGLDGLALFYYALRILVLIAVLLAAMMLALTSLLQRRVVKPLEALSRANAQLRAGNLEGLAVDLPPESPVEIQEIALTRQRFLSDLYEAKNQAEKADQAKRQFLAHMSHEIRTPLNAIVGMTDLTLQTSLEFEQKENLRTIKDSAGHLLSIINDILDFSKIEAGKVELEAVDFDLSGLVEGVRRGVAAQAARKSLQVDLVWDPRLPRFFIGDPVRLRQVLVNLVDNAVKFTDLGSVSLEISLDGPQAPDQETIPLLFSVRDTGIGVPLDKRQIIFDQFSQADGSTTRRFGGTGLGLAITSQLVKIMGGELRLESQPGSGSNFFFTISLPEGSRERAASPDPEPRPGGPASGRRLKVLVAEDHPVNAKVARSFLTRLGHQVEVAGDGRRALEMIKQEEFDLVLMDLEMPEMDGLEATRRLRRGEAGSDRRNLPVIAMTAHALSEARQKGLEAGMNDYLVKPVDFHGLGHLMARMFPSPELEEGPGPGEGDDAPVLDRQGALSRLGGDEALLNEMHRLFLRELPAYQDRLRMAMESGDLKEIVLQAHTLKGTSATVGAEAARQSAFKLEQLGRAGQLEGLDQAWREMRAQLQRTEERLREIMEP